MEHTQALDEEEIPSQTEDDTNVDSDKPNSNVSGVTHFDNVQGYTYPKPSVPFELPINPKLCHSLVCGG